MSKNNQQNSNMTLQVVRGDHCATALTIQTGVDSHVLALDTQAAFDMAEALQGFAYGHAAMVQTCIDKGFLLADIHWAPPLLH